MLDKRTFWEHIYQSCSRDLLYTSRIHPLPSFCRPFCNVYIKREDESGFGISGYKKRKFASLLPFLIKNEIEEVILIGGAYSNHIVGILQLLNEHRISYQLVLKEPGKRETRGNAFLLALLNSSEKVHWIPASQWITHPDYARSLIQNPKQFLIPEGGLCREAWPGLATLWHDIQINQKALGKTFDHLFIDAGTGLSAAVLQALCALESSPPKLHIVLMAEGEEAYSKIYGQVISWLKEFSNLKVDLDYKANLYRPHSAASFGSVNSTVKAFCKKLAKEEGLLCDPIYATKLLMQAQHVIDSQKLSGEILVIHSGGGTGLMGFNKQFDLLFP